MPERQGSEDHQVQQKWDARYRQMDREPKPARVLLENRHLLPSAGCALDLACGLGGNALLLAEHGLDTWAWDISTVAVVRVQEAARQRCLALHVEVRDVSVHLPPPGSFDVIVVSRFLDRHIASALIQALNPEGLLFYQTFTRHAVDVIGPTNPAYLLDAGELLSLFGQLHVLVYRDEGRVGDVTQGLRHEALFVGQKIVARM